MECPICMRQDEDRCDQNRDRQNDDREDNRSYPIAENEDDAVFVVGECRHPVCLACMKRVVAGRKHNNFSLSEEENLDEFALSLPLRGRCPMCRKILSLLDMRRASGSEHRYQDLKFALKDQLDFQCSRLAGTTFKISHRHEAPQIATEVPWLYSISFPSKPNTTETRNECDEGTCKDHVSLPFVVEYGDEQKVHHFRPGSFYFHSKTNTFQGELDVIRNGQKEIWIVCLQFSSAMRCICKGGLLIESAKLTSRGPLDGTWKVTWSSPTNADPATIHISQSFFSLYGFTYRLDFSQREKDTTSGDEKSSLEDRSDFNVSFRWPNFSGENKPQVLQKLSTIEQAQSDRESIQHKSINNLDIGCVLTWTTSEDFRKKIYWTLVEKAPAVAETTNCSSESSKILIKATPLSPPHGPLYLNSTKIDSEDGDGLSSSHRAEYSSCNLWGNSFIQGNTNGMASYHFICPTSAENRNCGSSISYSSIMCSLNWPTLDDGQPIPSRIYFEDVSWDSDLREFRGVINWFKSFGTTWQGSYSWRYRMIFDSKFVCVLAGEVWSRQHPEPEISESESNRNESQENEMSRFGVTLNYINAAADKILQSAVDVRCHQETHQEEDQTGDRREVVARRIILEELMRLESEGIGFNTSANLRLFWQDTLDTQLRRNSL